jgi:hypothetical protein
MRWFLLGIALTVSGSVRAQVAGEEEAIKQLAQHGIKVYREEDRMNVNARIANAEAVKALELLRSIKRVDYISMEITDAKFVKASVDALKYVPTTIKGLNIETKQGLPEADFDILAKFENLGGLSLYCNEVTAKQLRVLGDLAKRKRLTGLGIRTAKYPQEESDHLKLSLPKNRLTIHRFPALSFMEPLPIAPQDNREVRLKKQKLNAAIACIAATEVGHGWYRIRHVAQHILQLHNLRNSALDLDDADLRSRLIDDYVFISEQCYKLMKADFDLDVHEEQRRYPNESKALLHLLEYEYAEAQLTQLRLSKKAEAKSK